MWDQLRQAVKDTPKGQLLVACVYLLFLCSLAVLAFLRVLVYFTHDESGYLNPPVYTVGDNINGIVLHVSFGFATFLFVPIMVAVHLFVDSKATKTVVHSLFASSAVGTAVTVVAIQDSQLGTIAGTGVVILAGVWAVWWFATGLMAVIMSCKGVIWGWNGSMVWTLRALSMAAFGFLLLPILKYFLNDFTTDAVLLAILLISMELFSDFIYYRLQISHDKTSPSPPK